MIKAALEYIVGLGESKLSEVNGYTYSDKPLCRIDPYMPKAEELRVSTLTGLIDYIMSETDDMGIKMIVEVTSPTTVKLYSGLDINRDREYLITVNALLPHFYFDSFMDQESFCKCRS